MRVVASCLMMLALVAAAATAQNTTTAMPMTTTMAPVNTTMAATTAANVSTTAPATTLPASSAAPSDFGATALSATIVLVGDFAAFKANPAKFEQLRTTMRGALSNLTGVPLQFLFVRRMWIASLHTEFIVSAKANVTTATLTSRVETARTNTAWVGGVQALYRAETGRSFTVSAPIIASLPATTQPATTATTAVATLPSSAPVAAVLAAVASAVALAVVA